MLATRGADEAIDVLSRIFLRAGTDGILDAAYIRDVSSAARIQGADVLEIPLNRAADWSLDPDQLLAAWLPHIKLVYLCSPKIPRAIR